MVVDSLATHARSRPGSLACADLEGDRRWTYGELDRIVDRCAAWLTGALGPASGERVATLSRNSAEMVMLHLACIRAGAIFVPFNWRLADAEITFLVEDAGPSLMFLDRPLGSVRFDGAVHDIGQLLTLAAAAQERPPRDARRDFEAASTLLYTSGTSGRPKGVIVSEANAFWGATNFLHGNGVTNRSVFLCDMPLCHTAGLFAATRVPLLAGGAVLLTAGFDAAKTLARIADPALGVTHYFSVPQMAQMLWNQPAFDATMLAGLHVYATGGAPNPPVQIERFVRSGVPMSDGFGMSETGSNFGMPVGDRELLVAKAGSCGLPYLSVEAQIVDEDDNDVRDGDTGELWLRGPSVTTGYWNQPDLTANAFHDGWFRTGDVARRDADGFYFLVDRKKDMFISGGENVYPAEVEAAIAELPAVAECAVVGIADERWGEVGLAYVVAVPGSTLAAADVLDHCRSRLAAYKVPRSVKVTDAIARTTSGKVQKHLLRERALAEAALR